MIVSSFMGSMLLRTRWNSLSRQRVWMRTTPASRHPAAPAARRAAFSSGASTLVARFYKEVSVEPAKATAKTALARARASLQLVTETGSASDVELEAKTVDQIERKLAQAVGYHVMLDGRPIKTPKRVVLSMPTEASAVAVALEWASQNAHIATHLMPLTRLAMTAVDQMPEIKTKTVDGILRFYETDTLCYREEPERFTKSHLLTTMQEQTWDPIMEWFRCGWHGSFAPGSD